MKTKAPDTILILLLLGCCFISSCSSEPESQPRNVLVEQTKQKPLEDVIVASTDEVPTWDQPAGQVKPASEKPDSDK